MGQLTFGLSVKKLESEWDNLRNKRNETGTESVSVSRKKISTKPSTRVQLNIGIRKLGEDFEGKYTSRV